MGVSPYKKKGHQFKVEREGASLLQSTYAICYVYTVSNNKLYSHIIVILSTTAYRTTNIPMEEDLIICSL